MILNKHFCYVMTLEVLGRPQVVAPREGPHALNSTIVRPCTQPHSQAKGRGKAAGQGLGVKGCRGQEWGKLGFV